MKKWHRSDIPQYRRSVTNMRRAPGEFLMAAVLLAAGSLARAATNMPFAETFETLTSGDLSGQRGWVATNAVVQTNVVHAGARAGSLTGAVAVARQTFHDSQTNVWADLWVKPVFGAGDASVTNPPAGSSFAFYVYTNGQVMAFNGSVQTQLVHTPLVATNWVRFTVHSDYAADTWDLYLNGSETPVAAGLGFFTAASGCTEVGVRGAGAANAYVDDIRIRTTSTLPDTPLVSFSSAGDPFGEGVAVAAVTVLLNQAPTNEVRVDHFLAGGTAGFGADFTNYAGGTLIFAPGQTSTSFAFTVINDGADEPDETIVFGLRNFVNGEAGQHTNYTYTILVDPSDAPPTVSFLAGTVLADESVTAGSVSVALFPAQSVTVTVTHAVLPGGTAAAGADYTNYTPGTLTFAPGETNKTITFTVVQDGVEEDDETILFGLHDFVNAAPGAFTNFAYVIASSSNLWYALPFSETFESRTLGNLNGQRGWVASNAVVQTNNVYAGEKAAAFSTLTNGASHTFTGTYNNVWTDLWAKPVFGKPGAPPSNTTFAFFVATNGHVWAYDGRTPKDLTPPAPVLTEGQWVRFTAHSDYAHRWWSLYVNDWRVGVRLGFYDAGATSYSEFGVQAAGVTNETFSAYLDNVGIGLTRPENLWELPVQSRMLFIIR